MKRKDKLYLTVNDGKRRRRRTQWSARYHGLPTFAQFQRYMGMIVEDVMVHLKMLRAFIEERS